MSAIIKQQIEHLKKVLSELWLEESDCGHFNNTKKSELRDKIKNILTDIDELKRRYYEKVDEEENEIERQASFRRNPAKKRKQN